MNWHELQKSLAEAVRDPDMPPFESVKPLKDGTLPVKRLNVYRNNVALSLINNLKDTYPTVSEIVGDDFFTRLAKQYVEQHLPTSPQMHQYGDKFAEFISEHEIINQLGYLADVASLEWAAIQATHAADNPPITIEGLNEFSEEELPNLKFTLHPSLNIVNSTWPIVSIWQAHQIENTDQALKDLPRSGETALIIRPELEVEIRSILPSTGDFLEAITNQATFSEAVEKAIKKDENFNIAENLSGLFQVGAVTAINL